jgi:hypothetical protein
LHHYFLYFLFYLPVDGSLRIFKCEQSIKLKVFLGVIVGNAVPGIEEAFEFGPEEGIAVIVTDDFFNATVEQAKAKGIGLLLFGTESSLFYSNTVIVEVSVAFGGRREELLAFPDDWQLLSFFHCFLADAHI